MKEPRGIARVCQNRDAAEALSALHAEGEERHTREMYRVDAGPDRSILVTAFSSQVFGLDRQTGQILWQQTMTAGTVVELAILEAVVVAVDGRTIAFIDYRSGQLLKSVALAGEYTSRPVMLIDGPHVYVTHNGAVSCYTSRGDVVWLQPFRGKGFGAVALAFPGNARQADSVGNR